MGDESASERNERERSRREVGGKGVGKGSIGGGPDGNANLERGLVRIKAPIRQSSSISFNSRSPLHNGSIVTSEDSTIRFLGSFMSLWPIHRGIFT